MKIDIKDDVIQFAKEGRTHACELYLFDKKKRFVELDAFSVRVSDIPSLIEALQHFHKRALVVELPVGIVDKGNP